MIVSRCEDKVFGSVFVIIAAIVIFFSWTVVVMSIGFWGAPQYRSLLISLVSVVFFLAVLFPYHWWVAPTGPGHVWTRMSVGPVLAVVVICAIGYVSGHPREQGVRDILSLPLWPLLLGLLTSLLLEPVAEEIMVRGFLLNVFRTSRPWTIWAGAALISLLYVGGYSQYPVNTLSEMMLLSFIFAWARISSNGLLLPVLLHILAAILKMLLSLPVS